MQPESPAWMGSHRALRLCWLGASIFVAVVIAADFTIFPSLGLSQSFILVVSGTFILVFVPMLLHFAPVRIGLTDSELQVIWYLRRRRIPWTEVVDAHFLVDQKHLALDWDERYYSLHVWLPTGKRIIIGGLDGPLARAVMTRLPSGRGRLKVFDGARLIGVSPLDDDSAGALAGRRTSGAQ